MGVVDLIKALWWGLLDEISYRIEQVARLLDNG